MPTAWSTAGETVTDERGEFTFDAASREGLLVSFDPDVNDLKPGQELAIQGLDPTGSLPIELDLDCRVHLSQSTGSPIDKVQFFNAKGKRIFLCEIRANTHYHAHSMRPTEDGTYFPCVVPQSSRWIQTVDANGNVLGKTEVDFTPMAVNKVSL